MIDILQFIIWIIIYIGYTGIAYYIISKIGGN